MTNERKSGSASDVCRPGLPGRCPVCDHKYARDSDECPSCGHEKVDQARVVAIHLPQRLRLDESTVELRVSPLQGFEPETILFEIVDRLNGQETTHSLGRAGRVAAVSSDEEARLGGRLLTVILDEPVQPGETRELERNLGLTAVESRSQSAGEYADQEYPDAFLIEDPLVTIPKRKPVPPIWARWAIGGVAGIMIAAFGFFALPCNVRGDCPVPCEDAGDCMEPPPIVTAPIIEFDVAEAASHEIQLVIRNIGVARQTFTKKIENERTLPQIQRREGIYRDTQEKIRTQEQELSQSRVFFIASVDTLREYYEQAPSAVEGALGEARQNSLSEERSYFLQDLHAIITEHRQGNSEEDALGVWNNWVNEFQ